MHLQKITACNEGRGRWGQRRRGMVAASALHIRQRICPTLLGCSNYVFTSTERLLQACQHDISR